MSPVVAARKTAVGGEFDFSDADFKTIADQLYEETGIHLQPSKATLVYSRIAKRLRALGLESFRDYCALVGDAAGADEKAQMIAALTTNVTRFFREPHHFDHFKTKLLPRLLAMARKGQKVRIWSAGCSSGQEPFSIALTILSVAPDARALDIRILATDINPYVLAMGRKGQYSVEEMSDVPTDLRRAWAEDTQVGGEKTYQLDDAALGLVSFRDLNLMGNWPMRGTFDAIFCRNVVIYFDEQTQFRIWNRILPLLGPGSFLYIGHSERVAGPAQQHFRIEGTTIYRKLTEGAS